MIMRVSGVCPCARVLITSTEEGGGAREPTEDGSIRECSNLLTKYR